MAKKYKTPLLIISILCWSFVCTIALFVLFFVSLSSSNFAGSPEPSSQAANAATAIVPLVAVMFITLYIGLRSGTKRARYIAQLVCVCAILLNFYVMQYVSLVDLEGYNNKSPMPSAAKNALFTSVLPMVVLGCLFYAANKLSPLRTKRQTKANQANQKSWRIPV